MCYEVLEILIQGNHAQPGRYREDMVKITAIHTFVSRKNPAMLRVFLGLSVLFELEQFLRGHPGGRRIGATPDHRQAAHANLHHRIRRWRIYMLCWRHSKPLPKNLGD